MLSGRETGWTSQAVRAALLLVIASSAVLAFQASPAVADPPTPIPLIVKGKGTTIADSPWQVALLEPKVKGLPSTPVDRYFCTGSLIAPDVVVTAAHCLSGRTKSAIANMSVVAGRTWLNQTSTGEVSQVGRAVFPLRKDGTRRYRDFFGAAKWDVALLKLRRELSAPSILLAGGSEAGVWNPGRKVRATGWGVTSWQRASTSNRLRAAAQVILPEAVCRRDNGSLYDAKTMVCLGGSAGNSSTCSGDSGGPLVARTDLGVRLVGLTSFGDSLCRGFIPSVDTRVSGDSIRSWVRQKTIELSGVDPVGNGGRAGPMPDYCRVPDLLRRTGPSARRALNRSSCRLDGVRQVKLDGFGKRRVVDSSLPADWLAPVGFGIKVAITR